MSKRIYTPDGGYTAGFSTSDEYGWYREISDEEFNRFLATGVICKGTDGRYFAASYLKEEHKQSRIYPNPGVTLKGIASAVFCIGAVLSVILAYVLGNALAGWYSDFNIGIFIVVTLGGVLVSYLAGLGLAAFGDIALNLNEINRKMKLFK